MSLEERLSKISILSDQLFRRSYEAFVEGSSQSTNIAERAKNIIHEEIMNHPSFIDHRSDVQIENGDLLAPVRVVSLGDSSVNLKGWAWAENSILAFEMACDLMESIKLRFDREGIEIPFPHRTLIHKNHTSLNTDIHE